MCRAPQLSFVLLLLRESRHSGVHHRAATADSEEAEVTSSAVHFQKPGPMIKSKRRLGQDSMAHSSGS